MADASSAEAESSKKCPDTGQPIAESTSESEVSSVSGDGVSSSCHSPKPNPFQPVKAAKFVPTISSPSLNPFGMRPSLRQDIVSTSNNSFTMSANNAKFVLRPSALSPHPQNNRSEVSSGQTTVSSLLKPAKLPDPTKALGKDQEEVEKENEASSADAPVPVMKLFGVGVGAGSEEASSDSKGDNLFQAALKEHTDGQKTVDSSSSPGKVGSNTDAGENILGENLTEKVTGVHTSPKGHVSSSGFVFGENLAERVQFKEGDSGDDASEEKNGVSSPDSTNTVEQSNSDHNKTLEESAREYQLTHGRKTELQKVEVVTGEENESNVIQTNGKLFVFDGDDQNWIERGTGLLRLNDMRCESSNTFQSRLLMRTQGSLRLILNTKIWPAMTVDRASQKSVRITGTDGDGGRKVFLIVTNPKDTENLLRALDWRVQQLRVQEEKLQASHGTEKRKAEPESPTDETSLKKIKKSGEEDCPPRVREESDSSVVDPETEVSSESQASSFTLRTDSD
ncbi:ran-binding protein 3-like [Mya arenaria]|uniref:ran-binding protein 3-like n=1 Tax=Mya arenaria TaxID=6604 RepID=UPI0022DFD45F|nr:ran-binding protein 3-like [Mya arenaria]